MEQKDNTQVNIESNVESNTEVIKKKRGRPKKTVSPEEVSTEVIQNENNDNDTNLDEVKEKAPRKKRMTKKEKEELLAKEKLNETTNEDNKSLDTVENSAETTLEEKQIDSEKEPVIKEIDEANKSDSNTLENTEPTKTNVEANTSNETQLKEKQTITTEKTSDEIVQPINEDPKVEQKEESKETTTQMESNNTNTEKNSSEVKKQEVIENNESTNEKTNKINNANNTINNNENNSSNTKTSEDNIKNKKPNIRKKEVDPTPHANIKITGKPSKPPKTDANGNIEILFQLESREVLPLKMKQVKSLCLVYIAKSIWDNICTKISPERLNDATFIINGDVKASVSKSNVPFVTVIATAVTAHVIDGPILYNKVQEEKPLDEDKIVNSKWKLARDLKIIPLSEIDIFFPIHRNAKAISISGLDKVDSTVTLAVRKMSNGRYGLVCGISDYVKAKILNMRSARCFVTELSVDDFRKKYELPLHEQKPARSGRPPFRNSGGGYKGNNNYRGNGGSFKKSYNNNSYNNSYKKD